MCTSTVLEAVRDEERVLGEILGGFLARLVLQLPRHQEGEDHKRRYGGGGWTPGFSR